MARGGWAYRMPSCFVCGRMAVTTDDETGDTLCIHCYNNRIMLRKAVAELAPANTVAEIEPAVNEAHNE